MKTIYDDGKLNGKLTISVYNFEENGSVKETEVLYEANMNKCDLSQDKGLKINISGEALRNKKNN